MGDSGYMDAAAVPVPDTGDDTLYLAETATEVIWHAEGVGSIEREDAEELGRDIRDALLPRIRDHVAAAVQAERERARVVPIEDLEAAWRVGAGYKQRADAAEDAIQRVKALRPRTASGMIRDFVPYADLRAALDVPEADRA